MNEAVSAGQGAAHTCPNPSPYRRPDGHLRLGPSLGLLPSSHHLLPSLVIIPSSSCCWCDPLSLFLSRHHLCWQLGWLNPSSSSSITCCLQLQIDLEGHQM